MLYLLMLLIIGVYVASVSFSVWLMDLDNPKSFYHTDGEYLLPFLMCFLPIFNVLAGSINNTRFNK